MRNTIILFYPCADTSLAPGTYSHHRFPYSLMALVPKLKLAGYDVKLVDGRFFKSIEESLFGTVWSNVLFVGVTSMTGHQLNGVLALSKIVKGIDKDIPVVLGGWHASILPMESVADGNIDVAVFGQGEDTVVELADAFRSKSALHGIKGVCFKDGEEIVKNEEREFKPVSEMLPYDYSSVYPAMYQPMFSYISSTGCPFRCRFCANRAVFKGKWSFTPVEWVLNDLNRHLKNSPSHTELMFDDDIFFVNKQRVTQLCEGLTEINKPWRALGHARILSREDDAYWQMLKKSGLKWIIIGAETGSQDILDNTIKKDLRIDELLAFIEKTHKYGVIPELSMMTGFRGYSEEEDFKKTILLMRDAVRINPYTQIKLFLLTPYPGSDLYDDAIANGYNAPTSLAQWANYTLRKVNMPWITPLFLKKIAFFVHHFFPAYRGGNWDYDSFLNAFERIKDDPSKTTYRFQ